MGIWGKITGNEKALEGLVSGVRDGLDALVYTEEEKADDAAKDRSEARGMVVKWMQATQGQNLARRLIALTITATWLTMYLVSVFCGMLAVFVNNTGLLTADKIGAVGEIAQDAAIEMNPAVMLILAFYFAAPHMGDIAKAVSGRFRESITKG
jgi:hypothetical protein